MRLAVLGSPDGYYFRDLARAAAGRHEVVAVSYPDLAVDLGGTTSRITSAGVDLTAFDVVHVRTMSPASLEQVVFRMDVLARLEASGVAVINPPKTIETAVDKYLALAKLSAAGLPVPRTIVCQSAEAAMQAFDRFGGDVVVKPLFGAEGRGIARVADPDLAERAFELLARNGAVLYLQEFIEHGGSDLRALFIGRDCWAIRRSHATDWRTNVSRGATAMRVELSDAHRQLAMAAADVIGGSLLGIDLVEDRAGRTFLLEANAVPGWKGVAKAWEIDIAARVLEHFAIAARNRGGGG